jgi:hypothetical protein
MPRLLMTRDESLKLFYDALVNALRLFESAYGFEMVYNSQAYSQARKKLPKDCCFEDVLLQLLKDGGSLTFKDHENDGEYTRSVTYKEIHKRVKKTPLRNLADILTEDGDAYDYDVLIQTVLFQEVIFS